MAKLIGKPQGATPRPTFRPPSRAEADFTIGTIADPVVISSGGFGTRSDADASVQDSTDATADASFILSVEELTTGGGAGGTWSNLTPAVCTFDATTRRLTRLTDGVARVMYSTPRRKRVAYDGAAGRIDGVAVARTGGGTVTTFIAWAAGSLAKAAADAVDDRIAGRTASATTKALWTEPRDDAGAAYAWNASRWVAGLDLTCASVWNSYEGPRMAGTLISPRHVAFAYHYNPIGLPPGATPTIRFVAADGSTVVRSITNGARVGATDVAVGVLDSDVPAGVSFARVLPSTFRTNKAKWFGKGYRVPVVTVDQDKRAHVRDWTTTPAGGLVWLSVPTDPQRLEFYEDWVDMDSGSGAYLPGLATPVLVTTATFGLSGAGPDYSDATLQAAINAVMTTLGGGYQLTTADLSGYNTY